MKILGNIIWLIFGGLESALGYFIGSLVLALTIVGIPFAYQTFKIGLLTLWPFGHEVVTVDEKQGCLTILMNILWILVGGIWISIIHVVFGILLAITIVGLPFARQHFKLALLSLSPFGKEIR